MRSETGVGKTKLLTVYHDLISADTAAIDGRQNTLLALLQSFERDHHDLLLPAADQQPVAGNAVLAMVMQNNQDAGHPNAPAVSVAQRLGQLREAGVDAAGLHSLACHIVNVLHDIATDASKAVLNRFLSSLVDFVQAELLANKLLDKEQLACILHTMCSEDVNDGHVNAASAARKAHIMQPHIWQAQQHDTQACIDELQLDNIDPADIITPALIQSVLMKLAAILTVSNLPTFQALQMHAQISPANIWAKLRPLITLATACPDQHFTFFIDELNTSSMMGEMKSIFIDRSFQGVTLPSNIFSVAAINPARADLATAESQQADGTLSFRAHYAGD